MKKQFFFFISLFFFANCIAQKDSSVLLLNKIDAKIDSIEAFIKKIDTTNQVNTALKAEILLTNKSFYALSADKTSIQTNLNSARDSIKNFINSKDINENIIKEYKKNFEKIIEFLSNENAGFNGEILKALDDANNTKPFSNISTLNAYVKINGSIEKAKKYLKQPFDSIENTNYLNSLTLIKPAASNFKNLQNDIDKYITLLNGYCAATYEVGTTIAASIKIPETRNPKLYIQKNKFKEYDFLISQIDIARENPNYKFTFKANCTD